MYFSHPNPLFLAAKTHLNLKSRYLERVQAALDFSLGIKDFDVLVDLGSLYDHCLGTEPSSYVL